MGGWCNAWVSSTRTGIRSVVVIVVLVIVVLVIVVLVIVVPAVIAVKLLFSPSELRLLCA